MIAVQKPRRVLTGSNSNRSRGNSGVEEMVAVVRAVAKARIDRAHGNRVARLRSNREPARYGLADGSFARVTTDHGQCTLKVVVSPRQQRGMLFAPIQWSEANASSFEIFRERGLQGCAFWWRDRSSPSRRSRVDETYVKVKAK